MSKVAKSTRCPNCGEHVRDRSQHVDFYDESIGDTRWMCSNVPTFDTVASGFRAVRRKLVDAEKIHTYATRLNVSAGELPATILSMARTDLERLIAEVSPEPPF